jgi:hypothetical protein
MSLGAAVFGCSERRDRTPEAVAVIAGSVDRHGRFSTSRVASRDLAPPC